MAQVYKDVGHRDSSQRSKRQGDAVRRQKSCDPDEDEPPAPPVPTKSAALMDELKGNLKNKQRVPIEQPEPTDQPVPRELPVPKKRRNPPPNLSKTVTDPSQSANNTTHVNEQPQVSSPTTLDNPIYDGIIEITNPNNVPVQKIPGKKIKSTKAKSVKKKTQRSQNGPDAPPLSVSAVTETNGFHDGGPPSSQDYDTPKAINTTTNATAPVVPSPRIPKRNRPLPTQDPDIARAKTENVHTVTNGATSPEPSCAPVVPSPRISKRNRPHPQRDPDTVRTKKENVYTVTNEAASPEPSCATYDLAREVSPALGRRIDPSGAGETPPSPVPRARPRDASKRPTPQQRSDIPSTQQHGAPKTSTSFVVDKYYYNFVWTYHSSEIRTIEDYCRVLVKEVAGGDSGETEAREIEVTFRAKQGHFATEYEDLFMAVYRRIVPILEEAHLDLTDVQDPSELQNALENQFQAYAFHAGHSDRQLDLVFHGEKRKEILACAAEHGAVPKTEVRRTREPKPEMPARADIKFPVGFSIGAGLQLYIYQNDITRLTVDAVVNAANGKLSHGGGVAAAIALAAGTDLEKECRDIIRKQGAIDETHVVRTTAGKMPSKMVLHAVGPRWPSSGHNEARQEECKAALRQTFENVLEMAESEKARSVALPPISSGIFSVPADVVASAAYHAILNHSDRWTERCKLEEIHVVDIRDTVLVTLARFFGSGGLVRRPNGKRLALMEIPREEIKYGRHERHRELISDSPMTKQKQSRGTSFFGKLCGKGSRRNKYN